MGLWQSKNSTDGMLVRVLNGFKALCVQSYDEMNKKRGTQWSAARIIEAAAENIEYYSVLRTGAVAVDLKSREFAHTGTGLIADIFENPTFTGGVSDPIYNACGIVSGNPTVTLLSGVTVTVEGTQFASTIYALGPDSNQSKGASNALYGSNYILAPNTDYLLKFYSTDPLAQTIAARIEWYDGGLDVPNEDLT